LKPHDPPAVELESPSCGNPPHLPDAPAADPAAVAVRFAADPHVVSAFKVVHAPKSDLHLKRSFVISFLRFRVGWRPAEAGR
jgi:hypothetical protein